jgi:hypothetical protein
MDCACEKTGFDTTTKARLALGYAHWQKQICLALLPISQTALGFATVIFGLFWLGKVGGIGLFRDTGHGHLQHCCHT